MLATLSFTKLYSEFLWRGVSPYGVSLPTQHTTRGATYAGQLNFKKINHKAVMRKPTEVRIQNYKQTVISAHLKLTSAF